MRTKTFLTMAAMTVGLAMTGAMMTSCSKIDNPTDNPGEGLPGGQTVDLSMLMSDYVAQDGDTLRGTLDDNTQPYKISIAEGAKVVLRDAIIHRDQKNHMWAGITCEGEATIILVGENSVRKSCRCAVIGIVRDYRNFKTNWLRKLRARSGSLV